MINSIFNNFFLHTKETKINRITNKKDFGQMEKILKEYIENDNQKIEDKKILIENCQIGDKDIPAILSFLTNQNILEKIKGKEFIFLNCKITDNILNLLRANKIPFQQNSDTQRKTIFVRDLSEANMMVDEIINGFQTGLTNKIYFMNCKFENNEELIGFLKENEFLLKEVEVVFDKCLGESEMKEMRSLPFKKSTVIPRIEIKINENVESPMMGLFDVNNLGANLKNISNLLAGSMQSPEEEGKTPVQKQKEIEEISIKLALSPDEIEVQLLEKYKQNLMKTTSQAQESNRIISNLPTFSIPKIFRNVQLNEEEMANLSGVFTAMILKAMERFIVGNDMLKDQLADVFMEGIQSGNFESNYLIHGHPGTGKSQMGSALAAAMALVDLYEEQLKNCEKKSLDEYIKILQREDLLNAAVDSYKRYLVFIPLNSCNDLASLFGSPSVFSGASAGIFMKKMVECNQFFKITEMKKKYPNVKFSKYISSPICVLDEIDKFYLSVNVQNSEEKSKQTLSALLDKSSGQVKDEYVDISIPSRFLFFVATANDVSNLNSGFLGSRLPRRTELEGYTIQDKCDILLKKLFIDMVHSRSDDVNLVGFHEEENVFKNNTITVEKKALVKLVKTLSVKDLGLRLLQSVVSNFLTNISKHISEEAIRRRKDPEARKTPIKILINEQNLMEYISLELRTNILNDIERLKLKEGSMSIICKSAKKDGAIEELTVTLAQKHLGVSGSYYLITLLGGSEDRENRNLPLEISSYVTSLLTHTVDFRRQFQNFISKQRLFNLMAVKYKEGAQPFSSKELSAFAFCAALCVVSITESQPIKQDVIYIGFVDNQGTLLVDPSWKSKLILIASSMDHINHIVLPIQMNSKDIDQFIRNKLNGRKVEVSYCSHFNDLVKIFISYKEKEADNENIKEKSLDDKQVSKKGPLKPMVF